MAECVGGGARDDEELELEGPRLGRGEREGGAMRPPEVFWNGRRFSRGGALVPPEVLWAEFAAGKEGVEG